MRTANCLINGLIFLVALFLISNARADNVPGDGKIYSGVSCTETVNGMEFPDPSNFMYENDVRYTATGWAYNSNPNESIAVICPIIREYHDYPMKRAWVTALNLTKEKIFCQIEAYDSAGNFVEESSVYAFPPNETGNPVTIFHSNDADDNDAGGVVPEKANKSGYYVLICILPRIPTHSEGLGGAYIVRYMVDEAMK